MTTADRASALARAIGECQACDGVSCDELLALVEQELGHSRILDSPQDHGDLQCLALAPKIILHIIAGNTAMAGIQSLIRGLLLGSHNRVKLPSTDLPDLLSFIKALPANLKKLVEVNNELPDEWLRSSQAVIVFGSDETIQHFRQRTRPGQIFIAHGHRISFTVIFDDKNKDAAQLAARDVSLFDQQGCLSPHDIYVATGEHTDALQFAAELAQEMQHFNQHCPRSKLSAAENAAITALRDSYDFRQANDPSVKLWTSEGCTDWTVIYEKEPQFAVSPLNRVVFVKELPKSMDLTQALFLVSPHLSSIAVHPFREEHFTSLLHLGASRICPLGKAQQPSLFWHQDGLAPLSPLVRWIDIG